MSSLKEQLLANSRRTLSAKDCAQAVIEKFNLDIDIVEMRKGDEFDKNDFCALLDLATSEILSAHALKSKEDTKSEKKKKKFDTPIQKTKLKSVTPGAPKKKRRNNMTRSILGKNCSTLTLKEICLANNTAVSGNKDELAKRISKLFGEDVDAALKACMKMNPKLLASIIEDITEESAPNDKNTQIAMIKDLCNID